MSVIVLQIIQGSCLFFFILKINSLKGHYFPIGINFLICQAHMTSTLLGTAKALTKPKCSHISLSSFSPPILTVMLFIFSAYYLNKSKIINCPRAHVLWGCQPLGTTRAVHQCLCSLATPLILLWYSARRQLAEEYDDFDLTDRKSLSFTLP